MLRKKKKQLTKATTFLVLLVIILLVGLTSIIIKKNTFYKITSRVKVIEKYNENKKETPAIGWLKVQGTNIDYPIIYADAETDFSEMLDDFTWMINDVDKLINRVYIFGHNILNVSSNPIITDENHHRFEQLPSFMYTSFAKENKYIQYTVAGKDYLYKIFSVSIINDFDLYHESVEFSKEDLKEYIDQSLKDSFYDYDIDVNENDNIITLGTCTRFYGTTTRYTYKIDARMVREDEKITNYDLKETKNYKQIKEKLDTNLEGEEEDAKEL